MSRFIAPGVWFALACEAEETLRHPRSTWGDPAVNREVAKWLQQRVRTLLDGAPAPAPAPAPVRMWNEPARSEYDDSDLPSQFDEFGRL